MPEDSGHAERAVAGAFGSGTARGRVPQPDAALSTGGTWPVALAFIEEDPVAYLQRP
ncbi:hypothetical protein [Streptomyces sp. MMG1121]|uniref:hypothetical protein n=1 Tax=Streptomyces sp. MMG1121 TaxID=1415544 RepID=UPI00131D7CA9|nr:hypothetical protein [Streptomyces sp. MMG1121]